MRRGLCFARSTQNRVPEPSSTIRIAAIRMIGAHAGSKAASKVGELVSSHVIARPHEDLLKAFVTGNPKASGK